MLHHAFEALSEVEPAEHCRNRRPGNRLLALPDQFAGEVVVLNGRFDLVDMVEQPLVGLCRRGRCDEAISYNTLSYNTRFSSSRVVGLMIVTNRFNPDALFENEGSFHGSARSRGL